MYVLCYKELGTLSKKGIRKLLLFVCCVFYVTKTWEPRLRKGQENYCCLCAVCFMLQRFWKPCPRKGQENYCCWYVVCIVCIVCYKDFGNLVQEKDKKITAGMLCVFYVIKILETLCKEYYY